jgi:hypothetical protein
MSFKKHRFNHCFLFCFRFFFFFVRHLVFFSFLLDILFYFLLLFHFFQICILFLYIYIYIYIYITNLVCYTYCHWLFNPECQHIFGKQTGYICTFSVSLIWAPKTNNNVVDKNRNIYASLNQYHNTE